MNFSVLEKMKISTFLSSIVEKVLHIRKIKSRMKFLYQLVNFYFKG